MPNHGGGVAAAKNKPKTECKDTTKKCASKTATLDKVQYRLDGKWLDVPGGGFADIGKDTSITFKAIPKPSGAAWPSGKPQWGGDASGTGETKTVTFNVSGNRGVTVKCGKEITIPVAVDAANAPITITWDAVDTNYTVDNNVGDATCDNRPFIVTYTASADIDNNKWMLRVQGVTGGADIAVHLGGFTAPRPGVNITTEAQARAAIQDMLLESAANGPATTWATEAAIKAHEVWHYDEWKGSANHYWPPTERALERLEAKYSDHIRNENAAIQAIKTRAGGGDAKMLAFKNKARQYWMQKLGDSPGDRPYRRGGEVLNQSIIAVRNYARGRRWNVPAGLNAAPQDRNHCYAPWLPYNP